MGGYRFLFIGLLFAFVSAASAQKNGCPPVCFIYCEFGNVFDARGCATCECKSDPKLIETDEDCDDALPSDPCAGKACPDGSVCVNKRCSCKGKKKCPEKYYAFCKPSNVKPPVRKCPVLVSPPLCEYGPVYDKFKCPTEECYNPCADTVCPDGEVCKGIQIQCITAPCYPQPTCVPAPVCPEYDNLPKCEFGWVRDKNNCITPTCIDPCANVVCPRGEVCRAFGVACIDFNCSAGTECVPVKKTPPRCPIVKSTKHCPHGPTYDSNDCPTSKCHYPCAGVKCPRGEVCVAQTVFCIRAPCLKQPKCVPEECDS